MKIGTYIKILSWTGFLLMAISSQAQEPFDHVQMLIEKKQYAEALQIVRDSLAQHPADLDLLMMEVRLLVWMENPVAAKERLSILLRQQPAHPEIMQLAADVAYWTAAWEDLIRYCDALLAASVVEVTVYYRKAVALYELRRYDDARSAVKQALIRDADHTPSILLERQIDEAQARHLISASYRYTDFEKQLSAWHNAALAYTRHFHSGPVTVRLNYGYQFDRRGWQMESDWYPRLSGKSYAYVHAGYSGDVIFPEARGAAEYFQALPAAWEVSAGGRYFVYRDARVWVFTGSMAKYHRDYWIAYRPMLTRIRDEQSWTHTVQARRYFESRHHYVGMWAGFGNAPVQFVSLQEVQRLNAQRGGIEYQHVLNTGYLIRGSVEFQREEYVQQRFRNRISAELTLAKRF
jgi:YaiO family outer membrane protein